MEAAFAWDDPETVWAELPATSLTLAERAALLRAAARLPGARALRWASALLGLAALAAGWLVSLDRIDRGAPAGPLLPLLLAVGILLVQNALWGSYWLAFALQRAFHRPAGVLRQDGLSLRQGAPSFLSLGGLRMVRRYPGYLLLAWGTVWQPYAVLISDLNCPAGPDALWEHLVAVAPEGTDFSRQDTLPHLHLVAAPVSFLVALAILVQPALLATRAYRNYQVSRETAEAIWQALATPAPTETPVPTPPAELETVDYLLDEDGLAFTWDGGASWSRPLTKSECGLYGLESREDLDPLVLRQDLAAFLVKTGGYVMYYVTTDQGQSWQTGSLVEWTYEPPIAQLCLGFTQDGFGYAAVSSELTEGGDITIALFTTRDYGASWQHCAVPEPDIDATRPVTGLIFADDQTALASMASGDDNPWPHIFATLDGGESWQELPVDFADSELTIATRLTGFTREEDGWQMTVTQAPYGQKELVFRADAPDGPWAFDFSRPA